MRAIHWLILLTAPIASGCAPDPCQDDIDPVIEVGEGADGFRSIGDGAVLAVERGSQGGQHVWAALLATGVHPGSEDISEGLKNDDLPWVAFELEGPEGIHSNENLLRRPLDRFDDAGSYGLVGRQVPFRHWVTLPADWAEQEIGEREAALEAMDFTLRARVEDACGDTLIDEVRVRLEFPER